MPFTSRDASVTYACHYSPTGPRKEGSKIEELKGRMRGGSLFVPFGIEALPGDVLLRLNCRVFESTGPSLRFLGYFFDIPSGQFYGGPSKATKFISVFDFYGFIQERGGTVNPALMATLLERYKLDKTYTLKKMFEELMTPPPSSPLSFGDAGWSRSLSGMIYSALEEDVRPVGSGNDAWREVLTSTIRVLGVFSSVDTRGMEAALFKTKFVGGDTPLTDEEMEEIAMVANMGSSGGYREPVGMEAFVGINMDYDVDNPFKGLDTPDFEKLGRIFSAGSGIDPSAVSPVDEANTPVVDALNLLDVMDAANRDVDMEVIGAVTGGLLDKSKGLKASESRQVLEKALGRVFSVSGMDSLLSSADKASLQKTFSGMSHALGSLLNRGLGLESDPEKSMVNQIFAPGSSPSRDYYVSTARQAAALLMKMTGRVGRVFS